MSVVCLGEIMARFSTAAGTRLQQATQLEIHYGGGEANVAISLANYGHPVSFASKVPENSLGSAVKKHLRSYRVATDHLLSGAGRLGSYYVEQGIGERAAQVTYDRQYSAFALMEESEWSLPELFADAELFHISGITPALSPQWKKLTLQLLQAAKKAGCKINFDCNYRASLWAQEEAGRFFTEVFNYLDYCSAGALDAIHLLNVASETDDLSECYRKMQSQFPNIEVFYSTRRTVHSASANDLQGTLWHAGNLYTSKIHAIDPIVDRIGGGDAFSAGILHGILTKKDWQTTVDFATAASALKHTVKGDCNQFDQTEVMEFLQSQTARIKR